MLTKNEKERGMTVRVTDRPHAGRFEASDGERALGYAAYERSGDTVTFTHTVVEPQARGQGVAGELARVALTSARDRGLRVRPQCSYIANYIGDHPAYADLVVDEG